MARKATLKVYSPPLLDEFLELAENSAEQIAHAEEQVQGKRIEYLEGLVRAWVQTLFDTDSLERNGLAEKVETFVATIDASEVPRESILRLETERPKFLRKLHAQKAVVEYLLRLTVHSYIQVRTLIATEIRQNAPKTAVKKAKSTSLKQPKKPLVRA